MSNNLKNIFENSSNKSKKWEKYFDVYETIFNKFRDKDISFVEIGIQNGGSLELFKNYFTKKSKIIGIDINPDCKKFQDIKNNVFIHIANQKNETFWKNFFDQYGKVDIVLDDGGHTNLDQIITTANIVKNIKDGGILIIEDVHTSYIEEYNSNMKYTFINFSKKIIDDINYKNNPKLGNFNFSLSDYVYSVQFFESFIIYYIDREKCKFNRRVDNTGIDHGIKDLTIEGTYFYSSKIINFLKKIPFFSFRKLIKIINNNINTSKIKKYFK